MSSLLPPLLDNPRWQVLEQLLMRLTMLSRQSTIPLLVDITHESALDHLADQLSLDGDGWEMANTVEAKRALLKEAIQLHRKKGTRFAVKRTLATLGYVDAEIHERVDFFTHNSSEQHNATRTYQRAGSWTHYRLQMAQTITRREATLIRRTLDDVSPRRCLLIGIDYPENLHNAVISHDGTYTYGVA